jgi:L-lysine exporter family protein LysE/ArgO
LKLAWNGFLLSLSLCLDLGIVNVAILRTALQRSGTSGFLIGLGSCVGDLIYFTLAAAGGAAALKLAPLRIALWLLGTLVLLWMAWKMFHETLHPKLPTIDGGVAGLLQGPFGPFGLFGTGVGLALASPSAILWFAAIGGSVIAAFGGDQRALPPFAGGFFAAGVVWSALVAYGTGFFRRIVGAKLVQVLSLISAVLFLYFAVVVFLRGLAQIQHL